jgi:hypothetical protein
MRNALNDREGLVGRRPLHRKAAFGQVVDFFENDKTISDVKLRDDIFNLLMESGGTGFKSYTELLELFESAASEEVLRQYFEH